MRAYAKLFFILLFVFIDFSAHADIVVPRDSVSYHVNIRSSNSSDAAERGVLRPGKQLPCIRSVSYWHVVRLPDGNEGFVSKR